MEDSQTVPPLQPTQPSTPRLTFAKRHRLTHRLEFQRVYAAKVSKVRGPVIAFALPNDRPHWRLGLSIGRGVGNAVKRNLLKRHVREAFRMLQHDLPLRNGAGYDMVVVGRAHESLELGTYVELMRELACALHRAWGKRVGP